MNDKNVKESSVMAEETTTSGLEEIILAPEEPIMEVAVTDETSEQISPVEIAVAKEKTEKSAKSTRTKEIPELRTENRKVYRMSDGSEQAVYFASPIHEFDEEAKAYKEADYTLKEEADGRYLACKKKDFTARFSKEENTEELFSLEQGQYKVIVSAGKVTDEKDTDRKRRSGKKPKAEKKQKQGKKNTEVLSFEGMTTGVSYEYSVGAAGIKEDIVIREKADNYCYPFIIHCENLVPKFEGKGKNISFVSRETNEEIFHIPAPFMSDAKGEYSTAVSYEAKEEGNGDLKLVVKADGAWINDKSRKFPVIIDPQIKLSTMPQLITYSWENEYLYHDNEHRIGTVSDPEEGTVTEDKEYYGARMYMKFNMPPLPCNPRIKKAEIKFYQKNQYMEGDTYPKLCLYQVLGDLSVGVCHPQRNTNLIDYVGTQPGNRESGAEVSYTFDITNMLDQMAAGETTATRMVLKHTGDELDHVNYVTLYGDSYGEGYEPEFLITYESSYGVNSSYRTHTHELGRFGQGSIDLQCGNLMFDSEDFAWDGSRLPVTIRHQYNSALAAYQYTGNDAIKLPVADFSAMKLGLGWRLNLMQSMKSATFWDKGVEYTGYVYLDENGKETYFKESSQKAEGASYNLYKDLNSGSLVYDSQKKTLKKRKLTYQFDEAGRLVSVMDEDNNNRFYTYENNQLVCIMDGAGRYFSLTYDSNGFLASIVAPDNTRTAYTYEGELLKEITYPDGRKAVLTYGSNCPASVTLKDNTGADVYKVVYTFVGGRLASVTEYSAENDSLVEGSTSSYEYSAASSRTVVETTEILDTSEGDCDVNVIKTIYSFDDDGSIAGEYVYTQDTGNTGAGEGGSGIHPYAGEGGAGVVSNINNLLKNHNFKTKNYWTDMESNCEDFMAESCEYSQALYGNHILSIQAKQNNCYENGVYQTTNTLPAGAYTFSAYVKTVGNFSGTESMEHPGAYVQVTNTNGVVLAESEHVLDSKDEYARLMASFDLDTAQSVQVKILVDGSGAAYVCAAQLETNPYANTYNMLEDGNFERGASEWKFNGYMGFTTTEYFNMSRSMAAFNQIEMDIENYVCQEVEVIPTATTRETFTLSGWAKAYGLPNSARDGMPDPRFELRAEVVYENVKEPEVYRKEFSPSIEEWQFVSMKFAKSECRKVKCVRVYCDYSYNFGNAYFDDIQLVRNTLETDLSESDFGYRNIGSVDLEEEVVEQTGEADTGEHSYFTEAKDGFGNTITQTVFTDGEIGTIYNSFGYDEDGNNLIVKTDARGNQTRYEVESTTSRNQQVTDRCGNKTAYQYDASWRTSKIIRKDAEGSEVANVSYAYDALDNLSEIVRGDGLKYVLSYNNFDKLQSIGVSGKTNNLISYTYGNGNGRLKQVTYANGHTMKASYNRIGQMVAEKWYDAEGRLTTHYKYVYDAKGNIGRSIDFGAKKEYNYIYENDLLVCAREFDLTINTEEVITAKELADSVLYTYNVNGELTQKRILPVNGTEQVINYDISEENNAVARVEVNGKTVLFHSKTDPFDRRVFDEMQLGGTGYISRQFSYCKGEITQEHRQHDKLKSKPVTRLVSQITFADDRTISYEYDAEERVTKVIDSQGDTTEYTYDTLGQLLTETVNDVVVNTMTYDSYGNITSKNDVSYTYGDGQWKDLLTGYGDSTITYDAQGNPVSYLGHSLTWEKGRQLKSFAGNAYTYNAKGFRTSKTADGILHKYLLDGKNILCESWENNRLHPLYDDSNRVCGIIYNGTSYYFQRNLQGDVIAIVDEAAQVVASYTYDAWGVCTITQDISECDIAQVNPFRYRGYYYDAETGLYYLQSRYYDPVVGRFLNADVATYLGADGTVTGYQLFIYCCNNPVIYFDDCGFAIDVVVDVASAAISLVELIVNPSVSNAVFFVWDVAAAVVPFAPGSYVAKGGKILKQVVTKADDVLEGSKALADTYRKLKKLYKGLGVEIHHLVEKRFASFFDCKPDDFLSVPLTKELHQKITNKWRNIMNEPRFKNRKKFGIFGYGGGYAGITYDMMEEVIEEVYKDMPEFLDITLEWFKKHWKGE